MAIVGELWNRITWYMRYHLVGRRPDLWKALNTLRASPHPRRLNDETQLVLEGFPRSANTFAVLAFQELQSEPVTITHHTHVVATVRAGTRQGVPTVVLIRRPRDVVSSVLIRRPALTPEGCLRAYCQYYRDIEAIGGPLVLTDFTVVTRQFHRVVRQVNQLFETHFTEEPLNPTQRQNVMDWISELDAQSSGERFRTLSKPHPRRRERKRTIQQRLQGLDQFQTASGLYERLGGGVKRIDHGA